MKASACMQHHSLRLITGIIPVAMTTVGAQHVRLYSSSVAFDFQTSCEYKLVQGHYRRNY